MKSKLMISAAVAALIAGTSLAAAQGAGPAPAAKEGPAPAAKAAPAAPAAKAAPMTRGEAAGPAAGPTAQKGPEATPHNNQAEQRGPDASPARRDDDKNRDEMKPKTAERPNGENPAANSKADNDPKRADDEKNARDKSTTGQAGAGAKLTTEQRSSVRAAVEKQHVRPATNINFSISVGQRVPRTVEFYPVPTELVTIYPSWRGYEYFLVGDQIIIVNPRTDEIVAVVDA